MKQVCVAGTLLCILVLWPAVAVGQVTAQPRDPRGTPPPVPTGTGSISGSVTVAGSGLPARRARVSLSAIPVSASGAVLRISRTATTDDQGGFAFTALPAGRYTLSASKPGHVSVSYGQRRPGTGSPGTQIQLTDGQRFSASLALPRGGVLTGTVLDEHAEPTPGTQVRAMRYGMQGGQRVLQQSAGSSTDDRGIYRIYGLQPGQYIVCATPRNSASTTSAEALRREAEVLVRRAAEVQRSDAAQAQLMQQRAAMIQSQVPAESPQTGYAPVCYPGTTAAGNATPVALNVSEERGNVDFQLQLVPIGTVEGTVVSPTGEAPRNLQVSLVSTGVNLPGVGSNSTRVNASGRFRFSNVVPGTYTLFARGSVSAPREPAAGRRGPAGEWVVADARQPAGESTLVWATAAVSVDGRNVSDVLLSLQPGMTVSGHLEFNGAAPRPSDLSRLRVTLAPVVEPGMPRTGTVSARGRVDASGRFTIPSAVPGRYRLSASAGSGWFLESAVVSGQDSLDFPFEVQANRNVTGAVLTFTDRRTELTGVITDAQGAPATEYTLVAFPSDQQYWTSGGRRLRTARPGTDGRFTFSNLPPGDYQIATVVDPEPGSWTDPAYLEQLGLASIRVSLSPGEKRVQNIRISSQ